MECVNLEERFGERYKVEYEEKTYEAERPEYRKAEAPWLMIIRCRNGDICPWGGSMLAACTNSSGPVAKRLEALPFSKVAQKGDDGITVVFDVEHFEEVAEIMKPSRKRRVSEAERQRLAELSRRHSPFRKDRFSESPQTAQKSKIAAGAA